MSIFTENVILQRDLVQVMSALADATRLRILGVLSGEPLNVNEIQAILELKQSRTSRHLQILARVGLVEGVRDGSRVYYGIHPDVRRSHELAALLAAVGLGGGGAAFPFSHIEAGSGGSQLRRPPAMQFDRERLQEILQGRRQDSIEHFQRYGEDQDRLQSGLVDSEFYRERVVQLLPQNPGVTLDLGCGAGELARLLAAKAPRLICVDQSPNMIERAEQRVDSPTVEFRIGALEHLPVRDGEVDTVIASMVLHHMPDPIAALREISRALRPGGCLVLAELDRHEVEVMRTSFGDFWLGFTKARLERALREVGFTVDGFEKGQGGGQLSCLFYRALRTDHGGKTVAVGRSEKARRIARLSVN